MNQAACPAHTIRWQTVSGRSGIGHRHRFIGVRHRIAARHLAHVQLVITCAAASSCGPCLSRPRQSPRRLPSCSGSSRRSVPLAPRHSEPFQDCRPVGRTPRDSPRARHRDPTAPPLPVRDLTTAGDQGAPATPRAPCPNSPPLARPAAFLPPCNTVRRRARRLQPPPPRHRQPKGSRHRPKTPRPPAQVASSASNAERRR